ncbi:MAG: branched-chain amino acid ABC transporter permease [bacterium]|nr:branched-chain amino acid ABC transporter permease [bacterium]
MDIFVQIVINTLVAAAGYALATMGFSLVYGVTRVLHLAHSIVVATAAFLFFAIVSRAGAPWYIGVPAATVGAVIVAVLMYLLVYRVLKRNKASGLVLLLATLALLTLGTHVLLGFFGPRTLTVVAPYVNKSVEVFGGIVTTTQLILMRAAVACSAMLAFSLRFSGFGRKLRAVADNPEVAATCGISVVRTELIAMVVSALTASVAGILISLELALQANMSVMLSVKIFTVGIIGGVGSLVGALVGALVVALAEQSASWFFGSGWQHAASFFLLFLFLLFRPRGLFGQKDV